MKLSIHPTLIVDFFTKKFNLYDFRTRLAISILHKRAAKCKTPMDYVKLSFDVFYDIPSRWIGWPIAPLQIKQEIATLLSILSKRSVNTLLEIGTANGGTLFLFTRVVNPDARLVSLDLPYGKFGGGYQDFKRVFFTNFAKKEQKVFLLRANSHLPTSLLTVKCLLKDDKVDFLLIDGDHTYEGVKNDFEMYLPLVRKGGLIAFHDICKGPTELAGEVNRFWEETKPKYRYEEIIADKDEKGYGIGIIYN